MATPDRWAPWIEPRVSATGALAVTTTATNDVPGATVTFTPHIATRLSVTAQLDVRTDTASGGGGAADGLLIVELVVNGVAQSQQVVLRPQVTLSRAAYVGVWVLNLAKETTYTIKLTGRLNNTTGAPAYTILQTHTGFCITGMPNLHS